VIRIDVSDIPPTEAHRAKHRRDIIECLIDLDFDGTVSRELKCAGVPSALSRQLDPAINLHDHRIAILSAVLLAPASGSKQFELRHSLLHMLSAKQ
jgi:hypothetical protein